MSATVLACSSDIPTGSPTDVHTPTRRPTVAANRPPSGRHAIRSAQFVPVSKFAARPPSAARQSCTLPSCPPEATTAPPGWTASASPPPECSPIRRPFAVAPSASHTPPAAVIAARRLPCRKCTATTASSRRSVETFCSERPPRSRRFTPDMPETLLSAPPDRDSGR